MEDASELAGFGWAVDSRGETGVRIRRSDAWRRGALGCSFGMLLLVLPFAGFGWYIASRFFEIPEESWLGALFLLIPLSVICVLAMLVLAAVWQLLALLAFREEWEAGHNRLRVRRRVLGVGRMREYAGGELLLDPHYGADKKTASWRVLLAADGRRVCLLGEPDVSVSIGGASPLGTISQQEAQAFANVLTRHTGWPVAAAETAALKDLPPAPGSELPVVLRKRGFAAGLDERMRQTLRLPRRGKYLGALILAGFGGGAFYMAWAAASSWIRFAKEAERPVMDPTFWIFIVPPVLVGAGLMFLALTVLFGREQWTFDRNLLIVTLGLRGKKEEQIINGRFVLARVGTRHQSKNGSGTSWEWQLQLQESNGKLARVLYRHADDDSPRALGALVARATGWPLRETA